METAAINWAEAWKVSGMGFGLVFMVLAILAVAVWLIGVALRRFDGTNTEAVEESKEEESPPKAEA